MKILLHGIQKNLPNVIYTGLAENIGAKNVTSYLPREYQKSHGDTCDVWDSDELLHQIDDYDLIIFYQRSFLDKNFNKFLNANTSATKMFMDLEDDFFIRRIYHHPEIKYYYKRELYNYMPTSVMLDWTPKYLYGTYIHEPMRDNVSLLKSWTPFALPSFYSLKTPQRKKLRPFPTTMNPPKKKPKPKSKKYDLFFCSTIGVISDRKRYYRALLQAQDRYKNAKMFLKPGGVPKEEFIDALLSSKAGVSIRGGGYDANADWEYPCYGTALLIQKNPLDTPYGFTDGHDALIFDSEEELFSKFEKYVLKSDEWREIGRNGQKLYYAHHTPQKQLKELLLDIVFK